MVTRNKQLKRGALEKRTREVLKKREQRMLKLSEKKAFIQPIGIKNE